MNRQKVARGEGITRQRILAAAAKHFADASYDEVALRSIASDVGVDVSYVHHSFGSKERLFIEVLDAAAPDFDLSKVVKKDLVTTLTAKLFERRKTGQKAATDPLFILIRSLTSQRAGHLVASRIEQTLIEPIRTVIGDNTQLRAATIVALLNGFSILQNLLHLPAVTEADVHEAEALVGKAIECIISSAESPIP